MTDIRKTSYAPGRKKFWRRYWSETLLLFLAISLLLQVLFFMPEEVVAEPDLPFKARITHDEVSLRAQAAPDSELLLFMNAGEEVLVVSQDFFGVPINGNPLWYQVEHLGVTGWVTAEYVEYLDLPSVADSSSAEQQEYFTYLHNLGFPQDYFADLYRLHLKYPQWRFTPLFTNYSFDTAVDGEYYTPGLNLVPANGPDAHKSKADGDFSFATNTWYEYEYGWVGASREIIAYVMDPRNFLNEREIFQFENLQYNAEVQTVDGVAKILADTFMAGDYPFSYLDQNGTVLYHSSSYAEVFMEAANYANVNPYHLASRVKLEVSPTGSDSVSGNYRGLTGYYNFYNIGAYPVAGEPDSVYNGLITARDGINGISAESYERLMFPWTSPYRSILGGASFLGRDYINADQQTLYLQKFNLVSRYFAPFQHQYMGNVFAPKLEAQGVYKAYEGIDMLSEPKEFLIPVFTSLPSSTEEPTYGGSPNNRLAKLTIDGQQLVDLNFAETNLEVSISSKFNYIEIQAQTSDPDAQISGVGLHYMLPGDNPHPIVVTASNGSVREYMLNIKFTLVNDAAGDNFDLGIFQTDQLGNLYGLDPALGLNQIAEFESHLNIGEKISMEYINIAGEYTSIIGTGTTINVYYDGNLDQSYTAIIRADVDGDGVISLNDAALLTRYLTGEIVVTREQLLAMDVNQDGIADLQDAKAIKQYLNGLYSINQNY
ncbi:MAG: dockerin type I domain-containing protein [Eubacteriales bacterium]|nr:dockerin type I domain-containing protein [Eubacteriales bacterium]